MKKIIDPLKISHDLRIDGEISELSLNDNFFEGHFSCDFDREHMYHGEVGIYSQILTYHFPVKGKMISNDIKYKLPYMDLNFDYVLNENSDSKYLNLNFKDYIGSMRAIPYYKIKGNGKIFLINEDTFLGLGRLEFDESEWSKIRDSYGGGGDVHFKHKKNDSLYYDFPDNEYIKHIERMRKFDNPNFVYKSEDKLEDVNIDVLIGKIDSRTGDSINKISLHFVYDEVDRIDYIYDVINYISSLKSGEFYEYKQDNLLYELPYDYLTKK